MTVVDYGVVSLTSTLLETAAGLRQAKAMTVRELEEQLAWVEVAAETVGLPILISLTPRRSGALAESTEAHVWIDGTTGRVKFEQPAVNRYGQEYAPYVIFGHRTRNPEVRVAPNPYPKMAAQQMREPLNALLAIAGHRVAARLTRYMRAV